MFSMFFDRKKHRKFYWNIFESDDLDFFFLENVGHRKFIKLRIQVMVRKA